MSKAPRWVRLFLAFDATVQRVANVVRMVTSELVCSYTPRAARTYVTSWVYARQHHYLPGGGYYATGLFDWEAEAIDGLRLPAGSSVLVGGAGGGREMSALRARGFNATGFDPSPLAFGANGAAAEHVLQGSYGDLVAAAEKGSGPLLELASQRFDLVLLGWGSLSHVVEESERRVLLQAIKSLWPDAIVMASVLAPMSVALPSRIDELRIRVRARLGTDRRHPGVFFSPDLAFFHEFVPGELNALGEAAGYDSTTVMSRPYTVVVMKQSSNRALDS